MRSRVADLDAEIKSTAEKMTEIEIVLASTQEQLSSAVGEHDDLKTVIEEKAAALVAASEQHEALAQELAKVKAAAEEITTLRQQLSTKEELANDLQNQLSANVSAVSALQERDQELATTKVALETLKTELIDMEASFTEELDELNARLKKAEEELALAQEDLARAFSDRKEAQALIKQLEAEVTDHTSRDDEAAEDTTEMDTLRSELAAATDARNKAVEEISARAATIAALEGKVMELQLTANDQQLDLDPRFPAMVSTIERLRSERDDVKGQLSFVANENRFAFKAISDEKEQIVQELQVVQTAMQEKTALYEDLKAQQATLQQRVAELEGEAQSHSANEDRLRELVAERDAALSRVEDLETQLASLAHELAAANAQIETGLALTAELEAEKARRQEAESAMEQLRTGSSDEPNVEVKELHARIERRNRESCISVSG